MTQPGQPEGGIADPLDMQRARLFALLGRLLLAPPDAALLRGLASLGPQPGTPLGQACLALAEAAAHAELARVGREYHELFIGVGRGELLPFASYYLTGFLHERPLALVRADLLRLGIARSPGMAEPEDHLGFLCEAMAGLLSGAFQAPAQDVAEFFDRHLRPWAGRAFADLEKARDGGFYSAVGALGVAFIEIETAAAALPA
ncbi:TorD/DmsD family molecular chaperone [Roseomonas marmotae]|uniref:Molecular chaperone TorD family protein n=1 Tax=Roseomonas marmotae TaxID=2768161 RepID=A0ABS3KCC0_9PROT|nr:molecular chaperone TorD family protein [Roseomonas marmotae]MBO1075106.1 molecular chaperone TorD family protein [Roseomonas marmotae]QTI79779.1 molecular chaperone TorD family protein [Roseomonas marmotae]